jgi:glycolate oxidase iron-sulfur subunit
MRAVDRGLAPIDERFGAVMDMCLQCRACETACPSLVPFGRLMEGARAEVAAHAPGAMEIGKRIVFGRFIGSRPLVALASWLVGLSQRAHFCHVMPGALRKTNALRTVPIPTPITAGREWLPDGEPTGSVALLSGCVMDPWYSETHVAAVQVLRTAGYRVVAPESQTCCGALAAHEGAPYDAARMAEQNVKAFGGFDHVVVDSAGCSAHMKGYGHWAEDGEELARRVVDVNEFIDGLIADGSLPRIDGRRPIAVQDPCHLRHAQRIVEEPRAILRAAGCEPVEIDPAGVCCGAAGVYQLTHPEVSEQLGRQKAEQVASTGLRLVASANPGCEIQLKTYLGAEYEVVHPIEVYWQALRAKQREARR